MATSVGSANNSSDLVKDYVCGACESKNIEKSADYFCGTCMNFFCGKCIYHHDQMYANHSKYGRGETNKWPLTKKAEDLLLKCDVHSDNKLKMFCEDHSQLCCSDCVLLNHRQCSNVALTSESVKKLSMDMQQLSNNLQTILYELNKLKSKQEANIQSVEESYNENLQKIRDMRHKMNSALDKLENTTLKELDEFRAALLSSLKKDVDNCCRLKNELQQLSEAVQDLSDKSKKEIEFIATRKCLHKIQESEAYMYLKTNPVKAPKTMKFQADQTIEQFLSNRSRLGRILDRVMTCYENTEYNVRIGKDNCEFCEIRGICNLPNGQVIVVDRDNWRAKMLDQQYNVVSHCELSAYPLAICQITSSEAAVTLDGGVVQFISVIHGQLVNGRKFQLPHAAPAGIAHHQGSLYVTSGTALYHYDTNGTLVKKLYEDIVAPESVCGCAVSPDGDRIYVTNSSQHKLITLATDGTLLSTFTDPELQYPEIVQVTPAGQVLVLGSYNIIQVDLEGIQKLATPLAFDKNEMNVPVCFCFNTYTKSIIVGLNLSDTIFVTKVH